MQRHTPGTETHHRAYRRRLGNTLTHIFVVAVLMNYPWEVAQAPLYVGLASFRAIWWHCFVASLGDGLLLLGIFAAGWIALGRYTWFVHPEGQGYGVMLTMGLVISFAIEWIAVHSWSAGRTPPTCRSSLGCLSAWYLSRMCGLHGVEVFGGRPTHLATWMLAYFTPA